MSGLSSLFFRLADAVGVNALFRRLNRNGLVILRYHGVLDRSHGDPPLGIGGSHVSPAQLERQIRHIQLRHRIISLDCAVEMLRGARPWQPNCVVLTFDDGFRNNYTHALPVFERCGAPAAVFVVTGFLDERQPLWFDRLDYVIRKAPAGPLTAELDGTPAQFELNSRSSRVAALKTLKSWCKERGFRRADEMISSLEQRVGVRLVSVLEQDDWTAPLTWDQVREMRRRGVTIGSHTERHELLSSVDRETVRRELTHSRQRVCEELAEDCPLFCYPDGRHASAAVEEVAAAGYTAACATSHGFARPGDDLMTLKRMSIEADISKCKLLAALSGFLDFCLAVRRQLTGRS